VNLPGLDERPIVVTVYGRTDAGRKRTDNQDNFLVADLGAALGDGALLLSPRAGVEDGNGSPSFSLGPKGALLLVADGMGGAAAGSLASEMAAAWIYQELITKWGGDRNNVPDQFALRLRQAVEDTNARIHEHALSDANCFGMGTTTTAIGLLDGFAFVAQVGDSRAYLVRNGSAVQLTRDQSFVQRLVDAGTLTEAEAEKSRHGNVILQALGTEPRVEVDLTYQQVRRGDALLICSDGLFRVVQRDEIARIVGELEPADATAMLIDMANERGGPDNVTAVVARVAGSGLDEPSDVDAVGRREYRLSES